jgi:O-antigen/teichoic acid export membrane protein
VRSRPSRLAALRTAIVGVSALLSGVGSYVLLIVVSKNTTEVEYSEFAVFWSLTVTIGLGFYYPLEQETAREISGKAASTKLGLTRLVLGVSAVVTVIASLLALILFTPLGLEYVGLPGLVIALIASFVAYAIQFPVRGLLSGSQRTSTYSSVIATEGLLRIALPLGLVVLGITRPVAFAFVVAAAAALAIIPAFLSKDRSWLRHAPGAASVFASQAGRLIVAAFSIQLLLNSGILLAKAVGDNGDAALAGQILACLSIARIPVFGYQVLQILYLPRLAGDWKKRNLVGVKQTLFVALGAAATVGALVIVIMLAIGRWITSLLFGESLVLSVAGVLLVSVGVALFILALVASDGALATGSHSLVLRSWAVAVLCAVPVVVFVPDDLLRATVPLITGAAVAAAQLLWGLIRKYRAAASPRMRTDES